MATAGTGTSPRSGGRSTSGSAHIVTTHGPTRCTTCWSRGGGHTSSTAGATSVGGSSSFADQAQERASASNGVLVRPVLSAYGLAEGHPLPCLEVADPGGPCLAGSLAW